MRLIDADALIEAVKDYPYGYRGMIVCDIAKLPTIEAVKVSHGEWVLIPTAEQDTYYYSCSECGKFGVLTTEANKPIMKYCPHCGAKMYGVAE